MASRHLRAPVARQSRRVPGHGGLRQHLGRALLTVFEEIPAGKPELLRLLEFYYGTAVLAHFQPSWSRPRASDSRTAWGSGRAGREFSLARPPAPRIHDIYFAHGAQFAVYCSQLLIALTRGK